MFDHVTIRVRDREASQRCYGMLLAILGHTEPVVGEEYVEWGGFSIAAATPDKPPTSGLHIGLTAVSRGEVDAFWSTGHAAGYQSDGTPGLRPEYREDYYGAFLLDSDGNSIEAVHHGGVNAGSVVDHLWIRVSDFEASRAFYERVGEHAGFRRLDDEPAHAHFGGAGRGSFSILPGTPTTAELHMAFPAADHATVEQFHADMVAAGYRDNGAPGERPEYHDGYYGAFVLDPDGNNVELVNHGR